MNTTASAHHSIPLAARIKLFLLITAWALVLGPPIGGVPYVALGLPAIAFAYGFGALPALLGGGLFALAIVHMASGRAPDVWDRLVLGAVFGALGSLVVQLFIGPAPWWYLAAHGTPAGAICGALFRQAWIERGTSAPARRPASALLLSAG